MEKSDLRLKISEDVQRKARKRAAERELRGGASLIRGLLEDFLEAPEDSTRGGIGRAEMRFLRGKIRRERFRKRSGKRSRSENGASEEGAPPAEKTEMAARLPKPLADRFEEACADLPSDVSKSHVVEHLLRRDLLR